MEHLCSNCKHRNDFVRLRSDFIGDINPTEERAKFPRCMASRIAFVGNGESDFAPCHKINLDGKCELFEAHDPLPPGLFEKIRVAWFNRYRRAA